METNFPSSKRPRSSSNDLPLPSPKIPRMTATQLHINYLSRQHTETLPLAGPDDKLSSILRLIGEYEGVIQRQESMGGNLGARPLGPILLKRFERLFDGPPQILKAHGKEANVSWLDVVEFARSKPEQFNLEKMRNGVRVCQFYTKQCRVEISEEDYLLISSGMPQKLIPPQPIAEDEQKEMGALDILEKNLTQIVQLADQVSGRARQLNHKIRNRKIGIRHRYHDEPFSPIAPEIVTQQSSPASASGINGNSKRPQSLSNASLSPSGGFTAVNTTRPSTSRDGPAPPHSDTTLSDAEHMFSGTNAGNVTIINGKSVKEASPTVRAELMKQFLSSGRLEDDHYRTPTTAARPEMLSEPTSRTKPRSDSIEGTDVAHGKGSSTVAIPSTPQALLPHVKPSIIERDDGGPFKSEMITRMESMHRNERVIPPCDRCRRLHMDCLKNLTACQGCTKKHAKCSWKDVRVEELQEGRALLDRMSPLQGTEDYGSPSVATPLEDSTGQSQHHQEQYLQGQYETAKEPPGDSEPVAILDSVSAAPPEAVAKTMEAAAQASVQPTVEERPVEQAEVSAPRFDVRPPPIGQLPREMATGRNRQPPYSYYPELQEGCVPADAEEGDRLQALAAQVYRSASQSVRSQLG